MEAQIGYWVIGSLVVGFVVGVLVYRNNAKKIEAKLLEAKKELNDLRAKASKR